MLLYYISASASSIHPPPRVSTPSSDLFLFFSSLLLFLIFLIFLLFSSRTSFFVSFFFHRPFPCRSKPRRLLPTLLPPSHLLFSLFDIYAICHLRSLLRSLSSRSLRCCIEEVVWKVWKGKKVHDRHGNEALRLPRNKTNTG